MTDANSKTTEDNLTLVGIIKFVAFIISLVITIGLFIYLIISVLDIAFSAHLLDLWLSRGCGSSRYVDVICYLLKDGVYLLHSVFAVLVLIPVGITIFGCVKTFKK